jgi:beta-glucosidase-like glycosyl hydrolase
MASTAYVDHLEELLNKRLISMDDLDMKVANILRVKFKMNLFENYYTDPSRQSIILHLKSNPPPLHANQQPSARPGRPPFPQVCDFF